MADVLLAHKWEDEDPTGWWVSEKLDGVRALWRGGKFVSRNNIDFVCPDWFKNKLPSGCVLDGELWAGRGQFQKAVGIVKNAERGKEWSSMTFMVFDALEEKGVSIEKRSFEERTEVARRICAGSDALKPVPLEKCKGKHHLMELLAEVERRGGEGLMLRASGSMYERKRSKTLLKVKTFHDEEALVVGHEDGEGRLKGMCGAMNCRTPDGRTFKVGSGLNDAQRRCPPKLNTVITYRYQELTAANIPRFPTFVGERIDLTWAAICADYVPPLPKIEAALKKKHSVLFGEGPPDAPPAPPPAEVPSEPSRPSRPLKFLKRELSAEDVKQMGVAAEDEEDMSGDGPAVPHAKRLKTAEAATALPVCSFGTKCYRKNPIHFKEFAHPWLDKENESAPVGAAPPAPLARGS